VQEALLQRPVAGASRTGRGQGEAVCRSAGTAGAARVPGVGPVAKIVAAPLSIPRLFR